MNEYLREKYGPPQPTVEIEVSLEVQERLCKFFGLEYTPDNVAEAIRKLTAHGRTRNAWMRNIRPEIRSL